MTNSTKVTKTPKATKTPILPAAIIEKIELTPEQLADKKAAEKIARSAGITKSWLNPEVKAARATKNGVIVNDIFYKSVYAAFIALNLNVSKHIAFRAEVKEQGEGVFQGFDFKLVQKEAA